MNKNGAADLPAQGLAGAQAGGGQPPTDPSCAIGGDSPRPTLGHGPVPDLGWSRRLADAGPGDRLSHTAAAGQQLSRSGKASTAAAALEQALIVRYGTLGRVPVPFLLRSDNSLVFTSRDYTRLVKSYGLNQEFITPHCPQQNGMVERVIRKLKEQCTHRHRFETQIGRANV